MSRRNKNATVNAVEEVQEMENINTGAVVEPMEESVVPVVESVTETELVEQTENSSAVVVHVESEGEIVQSVEILVQPVESAEPVVPTGEIPVTVTKKSRRAHGSGSIWESGNGKVGICVQLGKSEDGKKLRHVQYYKSREQAETGLAEYMKNLDALREKKLKK